MTDPLETLICVIVLFIKFSMTQTFSRGREYMGLVNFISSFPGMATG